MSLEIEIGPMSLPGQLDIPPHPRGLVIFAHGSGSSRCSPRNQRAAARLQRARFATILFDLLTEEEGEDRRKVFDVKLLGDRVLDAIEWARDDERVSSLPIGLFGASTGAAAALLAAAAAPAAVRAIVSRGGRPDLAGAALQLVRAPTLLIVGSEDREVRVMNANAATWLSCEHRVATIAGATHLFEEPGAMEQALDLAADWFGGHLNGEL
jgi:pimeloyl-ACP methyl ester carboxylesterase